MVAKGPSLTDIAFERDDDARTAAADARGPQLERGPDARDLGRGQELSLEAGTNGRALDGLKRVYHLL